VSGNSVLVTGGSGYFGSLLAADAVKRGDRVRVFDHNPPGEELDVEYRAGDVRDRDAVRDACEGVDVVFNNVAQVPLAKDRSLFHGVNVVGTANMLVAARTAGARKVVHTSSSAIYGIPERNPVDENTPPRPLEAYGRAKLEAEVLCHEAATSGLDVTIIRPRTILGHGRLGIMAVLFELVAAGAPVPVLDGGNNRYQLVHAADLADACLRAGDCAGPAVYNIGASEFGTMADTLGALIEHAGTGARLWSVPSGPAKVAMRTSGAIGLAPIAPYHWLLYGESLWFDTSRAEQELGWRATRSNAEMVSESYDWFLAHRDEVAGADRSHHQSPVRLGALGLLRLLGRDAPRAK
jgi:nucleoside-diphosphate-sugar epimerase